MNELIRDRLYISGAINSDAGRRPEWLRNRVDVIVNLNDIRDENIPIYVSQLHWPIDDGPLPNTDILNAVADFVVAQMRAEHCVLVHCQAGLNRSGLVSALALRKFLGITGKEAVEFVRICRDSLALSNHSFRSYVESLSAP